MQKRYKFSAHITSLDPGNANKRLAYDVLKAIEQSSVQYEEVMLTGYRDYRCKLNIYIKNILSILNQNACITALLKCLIECCK